MCLSNESIPGQGTKHTSIFEEQQGDQYDQSGRSENKLAGIEAREVIGGGELVIWVAQAFAGTCIYSE